MKFILTPNLKSPYNLRRIAPAYGGVEFVGWTEAEVIELVIARCKHTGMLANEVPYYVIDEADLPGGAVNAGNDYFFEAWEMSGDAVAINMGKAQGIQMDKIRQVRNQKLEELDIPYMRSIETGNNSEQKRIAALKQSLRDIPQKFDLGNHRTPEALASAWPVELS